MKFSENTLVPPGMWIAKKGDQVLGWISKERRQFWGLFGFAPELPNGTTEVVLCPADYAEMKKALGEMVELGAVWKEPS